MNWIRVFSKSKLIRIFPSRILGEKNALYFVTKVLKMAFEVK